MGKILLLKQSSCLLRWRKKTCPLRGPPRSLNTPRPRSGISCSRRSPTQSLQMPRKRRSPSTGHCKSVSLPTISLSRNKYFLKVEIASWLSQEFFSRLHQSEREALVLSYGKDIIALHWLLIGRIKLWNRIFYRCAFVQDCLIDIINFFESLSVVTNLKIYFWCFDNSCVE